MKKLDEIFSDRQIIEYICRIRAKHAKQRSQRHLVQNLTEDKDYNYHLQYNKRKETADTDEALLSTILPSRRKWKKLSKDNRYDRRRRNGQTISSVEYNFRSLMVTIAYYRKNNPKEPFLLALDSFVKEIQKALNDPQYRIASPKIHPKPKGEKKGKYYRPIASFGLKDRIIIRLVNKYYTELFDGYFSPSSFAFRASGEMNHHEAVQKVLDYKERFKGKALWVAESDIRTFFDSASHDIIRSSFSELIQKAEIDIPQFYDKRPEHIFYGYLDAYSFKDDVLPLNSNTEYWKRKNILDGQFKWIADRLKEIHKGDYKGSRIGIPQGGALSGLIANIVLNKADEVIGNSFDHKLLYVRFCDDMVLIHPNMRICRKAIHKYERILKSLKLVPYPLKKPSTDNRKDFWNDDIKSKGPYKWALKNPNAFEWVGFVGYEIKYDGMLRVRKRSLKKEMNKQKDVVDRIISAIQKHRRRTDKKIMESATNRLIGMSVGRVELWNCDTTHNEMCWTRGFSKLIYQKNNKYLKTQLRQLDRGRNKWICILEKAIKKLPPLPPRRDLTLSTRKNIQDIKYGKPFSYYYQILEKKRPRKSIAPLEVTQ